MTLYYPCNQGKAMESAGRSLELALREVDELKRQINETNKEREGRWVIYFICTQARICFLWTCFIDVCGDAGTVMPCISKIEDLPQ